MLYEVITDAMNFIGGVAAKRGTVIFVGTKRAASKSIAEEGMEHGAAGIQRLQLVLVRNNFV